MKVILSILLLFSVLLKDIIILVVAHDEEIVLLESSEKSGEKENKEEVKDIDDKLLQNLANRSSSLLVFENVSNDIGYVFKGATVSYLEIHSPPPK